MWHLIRIIRLPSRIELTSVENQRWPMNLIAGFYVANYESCELTPLKRYLPFDFE
jgi:hypothetical protein